MPRNQTSSAVTLAKSFAEQWTKEQRLLDSKASETRVWLEDAIDVRSDGLL